MAVKYNNGKQGAPAVMKRVLSGGNPAQAPGNFAHPKVAASAGKLQRPGSGPIGPAAKSGGMVKATKTAPTVRPANSGHPPSSGKFFPGTTPAATYPSNKPRPMRGKAVTTGGTGPTTRPGQVRIPSGGGVNVQGR